MNYIAIIREGEEEVMKVQKPVFYEKFQCIGGECPLTCCGGWIILLEEKTYKDYRKMGGSIAKFAKKNVKYNNELKKYYINTNPDTKMCPMCDKEQLCCIVTEKGEDALGQVCREFPRDEFQVLNTEEKYLSCGCPKVVNLLMGLEQQLSFVTEGSTDNEIGDLPMMFKKNMVNIQIRKMIFEFFLNLK